MISYDEALSIIEKEFQNLDLQTEEILITEATNRILAEDISSDINLPPFTNSAMDGFAIQFSQNVNRWKIIGEIRAGNYREYNLGEGLAVSIMTGAKIPDNADTIIPIEDVIQENDTIILKDGLELKKGRNVREKGNDLRQGETALAKKTLLKPRHIAVAASCGRYNLRVYRKLRIGVLATGDELIDIREMPGEDKIRCSNLYSLLSAVEEINQAGINLGTSGDAREEIRSKIKSALSSDIDILITTGGVSVGRYDYVKTLLEEIGVNVHFWKVNIKPGKPVLFGAYTKAESKKIIFGLPGNPVSSLVGFIIFIKKTIARLYNNTAKNYFSAVLSEDISKKDGKLHFIRGFYSRSPRGELTVKKIGLQSSGNLAEMGKSNCLIIFGEDKRLLKEGEKVTCIPI